MNSTKITLPILQDNLGIIRSNHNNILWLNRKDTLRLKSIISKINILEFNNDWLDKLLYWNKISSKEYIDIVDLISSMSKHSLTAISEKKDDLLTFFDSIKSSIIEYDVESEAIITKDKTQKLLQGDAGF